MLFNIPDQTNWNELLETPPDWNFSMISNDYQYNFTEDDIFSTLQPSTFDFLDDEEEDEETKLQKKAIEEQKKKSIQKRHSYF